MITLSIDLRAGPESTSFALSFLLMTILVSPGATSQSFLATPQVSAGTAHSMALQADGTVWAWGGNSFGYLGNGSLTPSLLPVPVSSLQGTIAIAAARYHSLALKNDGTVWAWGMNLGGKLGNTSPSLGLMVTTPIQVMNLTGVTAISTQLNHSLALKSDGSVWAWGSNIYGQLGTQMPLSAPTPISVPGLSGITSIAVGRFFSLALKSDGTVWAWGSGTIGQLGTGFLTSSGTPVLVPGLTGILAVDCGSRHSVALKNDGTVWTWGFIPDWNTGSPSLSSTVPIQIANQSGIVSIAAGRDHGMSLDQNSNVWTWGSNDYGQLGDGTTASAVTPVQVANLAGVTAISGGDRHSMAVLGGGAIWACGANTVGELGNGTNASSSFVVQTSGLNLLSTGPLLAITQTGGPGTPVTLHNGNLIPGHEYFNIFSADFCPSGPGTGLPSLLGLCANSMSAIATQMALPLESPPFHFQAPIINPTWGPYTSYPMTLDAVCLDVTNGTLLAVGPVVRMWVQ